MRTLYELKFGAKFDLVASACQNNGEMRSHCGELRGESLRIWRTRLFLLVSISIRCVYQGRIQDLKLGGDVKLMVTINIIDQRRVSGGRV